jgi:hypothetical protein
MSRHELHQSHRASRTSFTKVLLRRTTMDIPCRLSVLPSSPGRGQPPLARGDRTVLRVATPPRRGRGRTTPALRTTWPVAMQRIGRSPGRMCAGSRGDSQSVPAHTCAARRRPLRRTARLPSHPSKPRLTLVREEDETCSSPAKPRERRGTQMHYSLGMPASLITCAQRAISLRMN